MRTFLIILFALAGFAGQSQPNLDAFLSTSRGAGSFEFERTKLQSFIKSLPSTAVANQKHLRKTFRGVHATFLKNYVPYSQFREVFTTGRFDCLTATALFASVLAELNYSYEIIETNYHIFLIVNTVDGRVLLETTDRFGGLVTGEKRIAMRLADYRKNQLSADASERTYRYSFNLFQTISEEKLVGLMYFNQAVNAYNRHAFLESALNLERAHALYGSGRCEELGAILIQTVLETPMEEKSRAECLHHLGNFWLKRSAIFAAN